MTFSKKRRVAVTGIGMVTPLGNNTETTWKGLMERQSGIARIDTFDPTGFTCQIAAEVKNFSIKNYLLHHKSQKYFSRSTSFALGAAEESLRDAGIRPTNSDGERWGLVVGAGMNTDFDYWSNFQSRFATHGKMDSFKFGQQGLQTALPSEFGRLQPNSGISLLAHQFKIHGYMNSVHTACASSGQALGLALQVLRRGDVDVILAGGYDSMINPIYLSGFSLLGSLSTDNDEPQKASRPFDFTRSGFVLGEGAAFLVLEAWDRAVDRNARIYAEFLGEGNSLSAYRITDAHPSGDGAIQAIRAALKDAQISEKNVDYINAHGTSTKMNDLSETHAIKAVFSDQAFKIPVSSTKSQVGHLISAAGALEAAFCVLAIHHATIPMTANLKNPDPDCDLDYVSEGPRKKSLGVTLSNSFGFGGSNSCLVFCHPDLNKG